MPQPTSGSAGTPRHGSHPMLALVFLILAGSFFLALFSYDPSQEAWAPSEWMSDTRSETDNTIGIVGATFSIWVFHLFGVASWLFPVFASLTGMYMLRLRENFSLYWKFFEMVIVLILISVFLSAIPESFIGYESSARHPYMPEGPGGMLGTELVKLTGVYFGRGTTAVVAAVIYIPLFCSLCLTSLTQVLSKIFSWIGIEVEYWKKRREEKSAQAEMERNERRQKILEEDQRRREMNDIFGTDQDAPTADTITRDHVPETQEEEKPEPVPVIISTIEKPEEPAESVPVKVSGTLVVDNGNDSAAGTLSVSDAGTLERADSDLMEIHRENYEFPPIELLQEPKMLQQTIAVDHNARGNEIIGVLKNFKCDATLVCAKVGPTVTRYEVQLAPGTKPSRVAELNVSIAMGIRARSARVIPVPENGTIGIEVPNPQRQTVYIREILESKDWVENTKMRLPAVLGKDVTGKSVLMDLAKMPHGLIAGTSGSGKSVCLNGIITSLLYRMSPDELKMMMVDPKVVELKVFNKAPHMLIPVITDMKRAPGAVKYLIDEMERRYKIIEAAGARNIEGFNARIEQLQKESPSPAQGVPRDEGVDDELTARRKLPYILCVIDEFADIMALPNKSEVELGVQRLTAKSRAAGIHLIIATQRPDAKTITGCIKSNLGTRIALRVTSQINSRIILDEGGAESLIGNGDMLVLKPNSPDIERAQGVWVSEEEVEKVVDFLAEKNGLPKFSDEVSSIIDGYAKEDEEDSAGTPFDGNGLSGDELLAAKAWEIIRTSKRASTSWLQTRLSIGYSKATRIITALEANGYLSPASGPKAIRDILKDEWEGIDMNKGF